MRTKPDQGRLEHSVKEGGSKEVQERTVLEKKTNVNGILDDRVLVVWVSGEQEGLDHNELSRE